MDSLSKVTVVIPTYGRSPALYRTLAFVGSFPFNSVVVLDGKGEVSGHRTRSDTFPKVEFVVDNSSLGSRMKLAAQFVESEYVLSWAHDEFWLPTAVSEGVSFLNAEAKYVHVLGACLAFRNSGPLKTQYPALPGTDISGPNPDDRLALRMQNYFWGGLWGLSRTIAWRNAWQVAAAVDWPVRGSMEILFEAAIALQGGVRGLESPMWLRSMAAPSITDSGDKSLLTTNPYFHTWWISASEDERNSFLMRFSCLPDLALASLGAIEQSFDSYSLSWAKKDEKALRDTSFGLGLGLGLGTGNVFLSRLLTRLRREVRKLLDKRSEIRASALLRHAPTRLRLEVLLALALVEESDSRF